jgi:DNA repair exonuclease SbcCD ATPase subunit
MKPRILALDAPIDGLRQEMFHTVARLRSYPFLSAQVTQQEALLTDWAALQQQDFALEREHAEVEARVLVVDEALDLLCIAIAATLEAVTGKDRKSPLYLRYFRVPSYKLRRPVLGEQLKEMRTWVDSLRGEQSAPALQVYGEQLAQRVSEADQVELARSEVRRKRADFDLGPRKAFVDRLNAQRQSLYGQLAEMAHARPDLGLPSGFATPFFVRESRHRQLGLSELEQVILQERESLQKHEAELARRLEAEELDAQHRAAQELAEIEAELSAAEEELAEAEKQRAELAARAAALRDQKKGK